jgi:hypothetical protein
MDRRMALVQTFREDGGIWNREQKAFNTEATEKNGSTEVAEKKWGTEATELGKIMWLPLWSLCLAFLRVLCVESLE